MHTVKTISPTYNGFWENDSSTLETGVLRPAIWPAIKLGDARFHRTVNVLTFKLFQRVMHITLTLVFLGPESGKGRRIAMLFTPLSTQEERWRDHSHGGAPISHALPTQFRHRQITGRRMAVCSLPKAHTVGLNS
jgi:hypothetical protein